jgi:putrescine:ornithine antiporter
MVGLQDILSGRPRSGPYWHGYPPYVLEKQIFSVVADSPSEKWLNDQLDKFGVDAKVVPVGGYDAAIASSF